MSLYSTPSAIPSITSLSLSFNSDRTYCAQWLIPWLKRLWTSPLPLIST